MLFAALGAAAPHAGCHGRLLTGAAIIISTTSRSCARALRRPLRNGKPRFTSSFPALSQRQDSRQARHVAHRQESRSSSASTSRNSQGPSDGCRPRVAWNSANGLHAFQNASRSAASGACRCARSPPASRPSPPPPRPSVSPNDFDSVIEWHSGCDCSASIRPGGVRHDDHLRALRRLPDQAPSAGSRSGCRLVSGSFSTSSAGGRGVRSAAIHSR